MKIDAASVLIANGSILVACRGCDAELKILGDQRFPINCAYLWYAGAHAS